MPYALVTNSRPIFCTRAPMTPHSRCGIAGVWAMAVRLESSWGILKG
jgi:hypothetical protein